MKKQLQARLVDKVWEPVRHLEQPEMLDAPLKWEEPKRILVGNRKDLFHEKVPDWFVRTVFQVMGEASHHIFLVITKRPERMSRLLAAWKDEGDFATLLGTTDPPFPWPNVWVGVSIENQQAANERIPLLLQTPAAVRFVFCKPLLGPIDLECINLGERETRGYGLRRIEWDVLTGWEHQFKPDRDSDFPAVSISGPHRRVQWVIAGGGSGPDAKPVHPEWIRSLRDQCKTAGIPFWFEGWGDWFPRDQWEYNPDLVLPDDDVAYVSGSATYVFEDELGFVYPVHRVGSEKAGRLLDGEEWNEVPNTEQI